MRQHLVILTVAASLAGPVAAHAGDAQSGRNANAREGQGHAVQLGPRPTFLVNDMEPSPLKKQLSSCSSAPMKKTDFSIGHRGAALQFPEHTKESYEAGARMGAGILECDVTFTKDLELVCRHSQNDLHTTTNILLTPLASTCIVPFTPAVIAPDGTLVTPATAECRTSELTLAVFKTLGVKMTPELKTPAVAMPFNGFTQQAYARKMIDEYKAAGVPPSHVFPQSFNQADILYWI